MQDKARECAVKKCKRKVVALGFCEPHYRRLKRTGNAGDSAISTPDNGYSGPCLVTGCPERPYAKRMCEPHYRRQAYLNRTNTRRNLGWSKLREYDIYRSMKSRCGNPNNQDYAYYGGRGISVCERWRSSFLNFLADMGQRPTDRHTIERIDNDGNYEPNNCKWATRLEQTHNRRPNGSVKEVRAK